MTRISFRRLRGKSAENGVHTPEVAAFLTGDLLFAQPDVQRRARTILASRRAMRFTVEQVFLANPRIARPAAEPQYHIVEADDVESALGDFLASSSASLVGSIQRLPGAHAVATARTSDDVVFTVNVLPGSDIFRRKRRP